MISTSTLGRSKSSRPCSACGQRCSTGTSKVSAPQKISLTANFAAYKGASAVGLRRLLHTLLHVGLNRGSVSVVFLDIAAAFDEVVRSVIQTVVDRLPRGGGGNY